MFFEFIEFHYNIYFISLYIDKSFNLHWINVVKRMQNKDKKWEDLIIIIIRDAEKQA